MFVCLEVLGIVEIADISSGRDTYYAEVVERRQVLARVYRSLPDSASPLFWEVVERADIPLEVLVLCLRNLTDSQQRQRILQVIVQRIQVTNEYWAESVLKRVTLHAEERQTLVYDLCADLYERVLRALLDPRKLFWEENFFHCLCFERKHVYRSFMMREGRWCDEHGVKGKRVPRAHLLRLDQLVARHDGESYLLDLEDEHAQTMLQSIEAGDLLRLVLHLPERLKAVVLLLYWEGRSEKDIAHLLHISDRTVRNRVRDALKILRSVLRDGMEDG